MNTNLMEGMARIRPVRSGEELQQLQQAAAEDNHVVVGATHLIEKGGEIVGYVSLGGSVLVNVWAHSQKVRARESAGLLNVAENIVAANGGRLLMMPCNELSPFYPHMERLGYTRLGQTTMNCKVLR